MRCWLVITIFVAASALDLTHASTPGCWESGEPGSRSTFTAEELGPGKSSISSRAVRHLEAASQGGTRGWITARTEFDPTAGFRYRVLAEGGSDRIRIRVLRRVLDTEVEWSSKTELSKSALTDANYVFDACAQEGTYRRMSITPRRRDTRLIDGSLLLIPRKGPLRLEGRLAKSPSFWVRWVDVVWEYQDISGAMMPVRVQSSANVRFFGLSTFEMTYDYEAINGQPIGVAAAHDHESNGLVTPSRHP